MEQVEIKTIGQLIDELSIINLKIWHKVEAGQKGDNTAAVAAQRLNITRNALIRAINGRLAPDMPNIAEKDDAAAV